MSFSEASTQEESMLGSTYWRLLLLPTVVFQDRELQKEVMVQIPWHY